MKETKIKDFLVTFNSAGKPYPAVKVYKCEELIYLMRYRTAAQGKEDYESICKNLKNKLDSNA